MTTIDHEYTDEIVCPWCGHKFSDSWEYGDPYDKDLGLLDCGECGQDFYASREIEVSYLTKKASYGTCKSCGEHNCVVEKRTSNLCSYDSLCPACASVEVTNALLRNRNKI